MSGLIRLAIISVALLLASWVLMAFAAKRLPPGAAKDLATVLPACLTTTRRLRADPRVPGRAKLAVAFAGLWVLSPIDLIPEFLPIIGPLDDVIVVALAFRYAARQVPRDVLLEAWHLTTPLKAGVELLALRHGCSLHLVRSLAHRVPDPGRRRARLRSRVPQRRLAGAPVGQSVLRSSSREDSSSPSLACGP